MKSRQRGQPPLSMTADDGSMVYLVKCPFHEERTPSCCLRSDGQFICFGCGASGPWTDLPEATREETMWLFNGTTLKGFA